MNFTIRNGKVFLPDGSLQERTILISGDRIAGLGLEGRDLDGSSAAGSIDAGGKTVLPGLIDLHAHLTLCRDQGFPGANKAQVLLSGANLAFKALKAGITTMRDMGGYDHADIELRSAINAGLVPGPHLLCAGKAIATTGGHLSHMAREADGPFEIKKAVREQLKAGADHIKVMCSGGVEKSSRPADAIQITYEELCAAVEAARDAGKIVAAHVHPARAIKDAVRAGIVSIEHGSFLDEECAGLMVENGCFLVPTFSIYNHIAASGLPEMRERARRLAELKRDTFRLALERGVPWGLGTDFSVFTPVDSMIKEMMIMTEFGFSNAEILRQATAVNAALIGLDGETGSLEEGKRADLIIVDGNPVANLADLYRVTHTIKSGLVYRWADWPEV